MFTTRRRFLGGALSAATLTYWATTSSRAQDATPAKSDRPLVALVGCGGRGMADARWATAHGDIAAVCDVDRNHADGARETFSGKADVYTDYRELLDRDDIDIVINGTPDHWHTKINVDACMAGKDVYAEKPLTLTIEEGKILREVVEKTGRIVQVGTQQRSERQFQTAVELVRNGRIGKLQQVWVALPWYSTLGGPFSPQEPPAHLDWDRYQGQAPLRPYYPQRTHKTYRWFYIYAGGIITDWGNHHMDVAHWGMDCELGGPSRVEARGIFPNGGREHCFDTPDRFFSRMQYPGGVELLFFSAVNDKRVYGTEPAEPMSQDQAKWLFGDDVPPDVPTYDRNGIMFIGDQGRVFVNRGGVHGAPVEQLAEDPLPDDAWRVARSEDHMANFFACVRDRNTPVSTVAMQHRTMTACHLTNISLRLKRTLKWDPQSEQIVGDDEARSWQSRPQRAGYQIDA